MTLAIIAAQYPDQVLLAINVDKKTFFQRSMQWLLQLPFVVAQRFKFICNPF